MMSLAATIDKKFVCPVCFEWLLPAMNLSPCNHKLCGKCVERGDFKAGSSCPVCRSWLTSVAKDHTFTDVVTLEEQDPRVCCRRCRKRVLQSDSDAHAKSCAAQMIQQPPQPQAHSNISDEQQKQELSERLYAHIFKSHSSEEAAKITEMLLETDNNEIAKLLEARAQLDAKVNEALVVLYTEITSTAGCVLANMSDEQQKEVLRERLDAHISKSHSREEATKITGMLLKLPNGAILKLLEAPAQLDARINEAVGVLADISSPPSPPQTLGTLLADMSDEQQEQELGERLYAHIFKSHSSEVARKITGMILEMDHGDIVQLLVAPTQLDAKVNEALDVLSSPTNMPEFLSLLADMSDEQQKKELGHRLYAHTFKSHSSEEATKITGMLLKLPNGAIFKLLEAPAQLDAKVNEAVGVLADISSTPSPPQILGTLLADMSDEQQEQELGERLYAHIFKSHSSEVARKITGMILEMDHGDIVQLLVAPTQLDAKVNEALDVLSSPTNMPEFRCVLADMSDEQQKKELGHRLYAHTFKSHSSEEATKITGMLLKLPNGAIVQLLEAPAQLDAKVLRTLLADMSDEQQEQELRERLYAHISKSHSSEVARKITRMLLEMGHGEIVQLLVAPTQLDAKVNAALAVLREWGQLASRRSILVPRTEW